MSEFDIDQEIRTGQNNRDIYGIYKRDGQWVLDRRYNIEGRDQRGLNPRTADLNLIGADILPVPDYLLVELGLEK